MKKIILLQAKYECGNQERQREIDFCAAQNSQPDNAIEEYISLEGRPTFNEYFQYTVEYQEKHGGENIFIIANSDIYLEKKSCEKIKRYAERYDCSKVCFALTRWDLLPDGNIKFYNIDSSQDTWIFFSPVHIISGADFYVGGVPGCDNAIASLLQKNGYKVLNPSIDIKTIHVHNVPVRTYELDSPAVPRPYLSIKPSKLKYLILNEKIKKIQALIFQKMK